HNAEIGARSEVHQAVTLDHAFVVDRGGGEGRAVVAVVDLDAAAIAVDRAALVVVDRAAAERHALEDVADSVNAAAGVARLHLAPVIELQHTIGVDAIAIAGTRLHVAMVDDLDQVGGIRIVVDVHGRTGAADDGAARVIDDGDRTVARDAVVARTHDR